MYKPKVKLINNPDLTRGSTNVTDHTATMAATMKAVLINKALAWFLRTTNNGFFNVGY